MFGSIHYSLFFTRYFRVSLLLLDLSPTRSTPYHSLLLSCRSVKSSFRVPALSIFEGSEVLFGQTLSVKMLNSYCLEGVFLLD